ncbi:MAG: hypothetical protein ABL931_05790 [Usitatibacteraceae bacterium]
MKNPLHGRWAPNFAFAGHDTGAVQAIGDVLKTDAPTPQQLLDLRAEAFGKTGRICHLLISKFATVPTENYTSRLGRS